MLTKDSLEVLLKGEVPPFNLRRKNDEQDEEIFNDRFSYGCSLDF